MAAIREPYLLPTLDSIPTLLSKVEKDKDGKDREVGKEMLLKRLTQLFKLPHFTSFHGLGRNRQCKCPSATTLKKKSRLAVAKKAPCLPLTGNDVYMMMIQQKGLCRSCDCPLRLFQEDVVMQPLLCFTLPSFEPTVCKTTATVTHVFCQACTAIMEACDYEKRLFNLYRRVLFQDGAAEIECWHSTRLDCVDADGAHNVRLPIRSKGQTRQIHRMWLRQKGLLVYPLPEELQQRVLQERKDMERKLAELGAARSLRLELRHGSVDVKKGDSDYAAIRRRSGERKTVDQEREEEEEDKDMEDDDDDDDDDERKKGQEPPLKRQRITPSSMAPPGGGGQMSLSMDEHDGDNDETIDRSELLDLQPEEFFESDAGFTTFWVPIDARRSVAGRSLLGLSKTALTRKMPISESNYLFTIELLARMERLFDYGEFIRWALQTLRRHPVKFAGLASKKLEVTAADVEELKSLRNLLVQQRKVLEEKKVLIVRSAEIKEQENKIKQKWTEKLMLPGTTLDLSVFEQLDLKPVVSKARKKVKNRATNDAQDVLASNLPLLLVRHNVVPRPQSGREVNELMKKCTVIADDLSSFTGAGGYEGSQMTQSKLSFRIPSLSATATKPKAKAKAKSKSKSAGKATSIGSRP